MKRIYKKEENELYMYDTLFKLVLSSIMSLCSLIFNLFLKELAKITNHHKNRNIYDICQYIDHVRILCLSCNVENPKTTAKLYKKRAETSVVLIVS
jgi:hypothetical protein